MIVSLQKTRIKPLGSYGLLFLYDFGGIVFLIEGWNFFRFICVLNKSLMGMERNECELLITEFEF